MRSETEARDIDVLLARHVGNLQREMRAGFADMRKEMRAGFEQADQRFDILERKLDEVIDSLGERDEPEGSLSRQLRELKGGL